jgi:hypothetical protein
MLALLGIILPSILAARTPNHAPPACITCPGDNLVWVNTRSHIYHFQGERYFGSTEEGKLALSQISRADMQGLRI